MINQILEFASNEIMVLLMGAMPVMELKGAIPFGVSLGLSPIHAAILGLIGSMIPVPFLLILLKPVFIKLRKSPYWTKVINRITQRTLRKTKQIQKYKSLGLLLFVAIPLPTTGVWTGSIAAALLNIPLRYAFVSILVGNCIAAFIVMTLSHVAVNL
ncbi:COG2426 family protein [Marinisporobacter balticus]|uniref:Putative membrane protein n=1 Tax=Marinisporobacter balticus TaxID=2018667 RepID=A0A4R2L1P5_9FIRM|nr:small multi-drug export protein [Marinisporobacter balticus]TCO76478.1 putative membrane protein [Marinisporobacter balticus]